MANEEYYEKELDCLQVGILNRLNNIKKWAQNASCSPKLIDDIENAQEAVTFTSDRIKSVHEELRFGAEILAAFSDHLMEMNVSNTKKLKEKLESKIGKCNDLKLYERELALETNSWASAAVRQQRLAIKLLCQREQACVEILQNISKIFEGGLDLGADGIAREGGDIIRSLKILMSAGKYQREESDEGAEELEPIVNRLRELEPYSRRQKVSFLIPGDDTQSSASGDYDNDLESDSPYLLLTRGIPPEKSGDSSLNSSTVNQESGTSLSTYRVAEKSGQTPAASHPQDKAPANSGSPRDVRQEKSDSPTLDLSDAAECEKEDSMPAQDKAPNLDSPGDVSRDVRQEKPDSLTPDLPDTAERKKDDSAPGKNALSGGGDTQKCEDSPALRHNAEYDLAVSGSVERRSSKQSSHSGSSGDDSCPGGSEGILTRTARCAEDNNNKDEGAAGQTDTSYVGTAPVPGEMSVLSKIQVGEITSAEIDTTSDAEPEHECVAPEHEYTIQKDHTSRVADDTRSEDDGCLSYANKYSPTNPPASHDSRTWSPFEPSLSSGILQPRDNPTPPQEDLESKLHEDSSMPHNLVSGIADLMPEGTPSLSNTAQVSHDSRRYLAINKQSDLENSVKGRSAEAADGGEKEDGEAVSILNLEDRRQNIDIPESDSANVSPGHNANAESSKSRDGDDASAAPYLPAGSKPPENQPSAGSTAHAVDEHDKRASYNNSTAAAGADAPEPPVISRPDPEADPEANSEKNPDPRYSSVRKEDAEFGQVDGAGSDKGKMDSGSPISHAEKDIENAESEKESANSEPQTEQRVCYEPQPGHNADPDPQTAQLHQGPQRAERAGSPAASKTESSHDFHSARSSKSIYGHTASEGENKHNGKDRRKDIPSAQKDDSANPPDKDEHIAPSSAHSQYRGSLLKRLMDIDISHEYPGIFMSFENSKMPTLEPPEVLELLNIYRAQVAATVQERDDLSRMVSSLREKINTMEAERDTSRVDSSEKQVTKNSTSQLSDQEGNFATAVSQNTDNVIGVASSSALSGQESAERGNEAEVGVLAAASARVEYEGAVKAGSEDTEDKIDSGSANSKSVIKSLDALSSESLRQLAAQASQSQTAESDKNLVREHSERSQPNLDVCSTKSKVENEIAAEYEKYQDTPDTVPLIYRILAKNPPHPHNSHTDVSGSSSTKIEKILEVLLSRIKSGIEVMEHNLPTSKLSASDSSMIKSQEENIILVKALFDHISQYERKIMEQEEIIKLRDEEIAFLHKASAPGVEGLFAHKKALELQVESLLKQLVNAEFELSRSKTEVKEIRDALKVLESYLILEREKNDNAVSGQGLHSKPGYGDANRKLPTSSSGPGAKSSSTMKFNEDEASNYKKMVDFANNPKKYKLVPSPDDSSIVSAVKLRTNLPKAIISQELSLEKKKKKRKEIHSGLRKQSLGWKEFMNSEYSRASMGRDIGSYFDYSANNSPNMVARSNILNPQSQHAFE